MEKRFKVGLPDVVVLDDRTRTTLREISRLEQPRNATHIILPIAEKVHEISERHGYTAKDLERITPEFNDAMHAVIADYERALHKVDRKIKMLEDDKKMLVNEAARLHKIAANNTDEKIMRLKRIVQILGEATRVEERLTALKRERKQNIDSLKGLFVRAPIAYFVHLARRGDERKVHPAITDAFFAAIIERKKKPS